MIPAMHRNQGVSPDGHLSEEQINDLVDGLLRADQRGDIDRHLTGCDTCKREISALAELVGASRADAELVVAPLFLQPVVLASTLYERQMRRWAVRALRRPVIIGVIAIVGVCSTLTGWILLACPDRRATSALSSYADNGRALASASLETRCTEPWYFVVRDAARARYKQLRNWQRDGARDLVGKQRR